MALHITSFPKTGIKVIIVGAGFGGLTAAIESYLKGHDVVVLEQTPKWEQLGDIISIGTSLSCLGQNIDHKGRSQRSLLVVQSRNYCGQTRVGNQRDRRRSIVVLFVRSLFPHFN